MWFTNEDMWHLKDRKELLLCNLKVLVVATAVVSCIAQYFIEDMYLDWFRFSGYVSYLSSL